MSQLRFLSPLWRVFEDTFFTQEGGDGRVLQTTRFYVPVWIYLRVAILEEARLLKETAPSFFPQYTNRAVSHW